MTIAVLVCGIEYFVPSDSECIFRCFELSLVLFQAKRSGDEPFVEVLLLQQLVWREVVRTVDCSVKGLIIRFVLFGWLLGCMFVVRQFAPLYGWVSVEVGFGAAIMPPL